MEWFKPLHGKIKSHEIAAFDIEGSGVEGGFVCGSIVSSARCSFYVSPGDMMDDLLSLGASGVWIFSHNLQYDLPILEGDNFPAGDMLFTRYNILWAEYTHWKRTVKFYDSANLFPRLSVEYLGELVGLPKLPMDKQTIKLLSQARPLSFFDSADQEKIKRYCMRDAEVVYRAVTLMQEIVNELGGNLHPTLAGCSMDIYRRKYMKWPWPCIGPVTNETIRPAYYGGRVENYITGNAEHVNMFDVTSLYPSVQKDIRYPHPSHLSMEVMPNTCGKWLETEGVAACVIDVPDTFVPILPYREGKRLFFPTGQLQGVWSIMEIREAMLRGYQLQYVDWVISSKVTFNPFHEFIERLFDLRQFFIFEKDGAANIIKLLLNSLYGRWGLNPEGGLYRLVDLETVKSFDDIQGYTTHDINGRLFAYGNIQSKTLPPYVNVFFAAQITAAARLKLYDSLVSQETDLVYCDTDSIITRSSMPTGDGLGDWRLQMQDGSADIAGPKEYAIHNQALGTKYVVKGVPAEVSQEYFRTGVARYFRALNIRESMGSGGRPSTWVETFRAHSEIAPKRYQAYPLPTWGQNCFLTLPYPISELQEVASGHFRVEPFRYDGQYQSLPVERLPVQSHFLEEIEAHQKKSREGVPFRSVSSK